MFRFTPVVKNLLIINGLFFLARMTYPAFMYEHFTLFHPYSDVFAPHQFVTHIFMHADASHIFGNMFALFIFGPMLEESWGAKKFLIYYAITGFGAAALQLGVRHIEIEQLIGVLNPSQLDLVYNGLYLDESELEKFTIEMGKLFGLINGPMLGASGAVFGILLGFGMMFPNMTIYLNFLFPIKAKFIVILYGAFEVFAILSGTQDGVAHYAHIGGMLFGYALIKRWGFRRIM